jgi:hypothetical protein
MQPMIEMIFATGRMPLSIEVVIDMRGFETHPT